MATNTSPTIAIIATRTLFTVLTLLVTAGAHSAAGATLSLVPQATTLAAGASVDVDVVISGLGAGAPPSLGGCAFSLAYDSAVVDFDALSFGSELGAVDSDLTPAQDPAAETATFVFWNPGDVFMFHFAFPPGGPVLDALQGASFALATVSLDGIAPGTTTVELVDAECVDAGAPQAPLPVTVQGSSLTVPQPSQASGLVAGAALLVAIARRARTS